jgi:hypothetical protein
MTTALTLKNVVPHLVQNIIRDFNWQNMDAEHPDYGGLVSSGSGLAEASHGGTIRFIMACGLVVYIGEHVPDSLPEQSPSAETILQRMSLALDFALRAQRPSGLTDLRSTNYDSSPDTGFNVELMCALTDVTRTSAQLADNLKKVETFIRRGVGGMLTGGFHTPNHRWVIISALSQAGKLFDDLEVAEVIQSYIAEGFDVDEEGAYIERSVGIYDTVSNRALLHFAESWTNPDDVQLALDAIQRNLDFDLHLLHPDGTAETGLSRRQDYGNRAVPVSLVMPLLMCGQITDNPVYIRAAQWLWEKALTSTTFENVIDVHWHTFVLLKYGEPEPSTATLPTDFIRHFPLNQIWRVRQGKLSASVFGSATRLMTFSYGAILLNSIKISQTYFGVGHFIAETMTAEGQSITLHSSGIQKPHKPGYELPLGHPVPPEKWGEMMKERDYRPIPPAESTLKVTPVDDGFDFHYRTVDGLDQVAVQVAFDFPAGGIWETDDTALITQPGQTIFLKSGTGFLRYGDDVICIQPGADGHRYHAMRHAEPVPNDHIRILLTFLTPVDHQFSIRVFSGIQ